MADFLDFLLSSPTKSPLPLEITSTTTLQDIIAATIQPGDTDSATETTETPTNSHPDQTNDFTEDDEALAAAILAEATAQEPEPTTPITQRSYSVSSPATETRLADSLFDLLGSPPPLEIPLNPAYKELQLLITSELKQQTLPETLFGLIQPKMSVFGREQQLHRQFTKLETYYPDQVQQLSSFFKYQSAVIETERYQSLHQQATRPHLRDSINAKFDEQLHQAINRVKLSVDNLEHSVQDQTSSNTQQPTQTRPATLKTRPQFSRRAIQLMEDWYQLNIAHPYPDYKVIQSIAYHGNIKEEQVKKWFSNKRSRSQNTHSRSVIQSRKMSSRHHRIHYQPY